MGHRKGPSIARNCCDFCSHRFLQKGPIVQQRPPNVFKFFAHVAPLAGLAALGLAAAPVGAQTTSLTLNSGDSVAVSGAGTVGTQNGAAVGNGTTSYDDSDGYGLANSGYGYAV